MVGGGLLLVGIAHRAPERAHVGARLDAAARRIDAQDRVGLEQVTVELAVDQLELVQAEHLARLVGLDLDLALRIEGEGIDDIK